MTSGNLGICCECTPVLDADYSEGSGRTPAEAVIDALAEASGVEPVDLPPLYDVVDPEALDRLFRDRDDEGALGRVLAFSVEDWNVFVADDGSIRVCDATRRTDPVPVFETVEP